MEEEDRKDIPEDDEEEYDDDDIQKMSTMRSRKVASIKFSSEEIEDIQQQIQITTKKIEHEKINLRINGERYEKKYNAYCELQGKPVHYQKNKKRRTTERRKK